MFCQVGDIIFERENSPENGYRRSLQAHYTDSPRLGNKDKTIYTGLGLDDLSTSLILNATQNTTPEKEIQKLEDYLESGKPVNFVLGNGRLVGRYTIRTMIVEILSANTKGDIKRARVSLDFKEFVNKIKRKWEDEEWSAS